MYVYNVLNICSVCMYYTCTMYVLYVLNLHCMYYTCIVYILYVLYMYCLYTLYVLCTIHVLCVSMHVL